MSLTHVISMLDTIAADVEADVTKRDGQEFTGRNVAEMHGELSACVQAVSNCVIEALRLVQDAVDELESKTHELERAQERFENNVRGHSHRVYDGMTETEAWYR
jgi:hypothetical protein